MGLLPNGSWGAGARQQSVCEAREPPQQGQHVFLSRILCGCLWWLSEGISGQCGDQLTSVSHGLSGKGVTMSIHSAWTEGPNSERPSSRQRSHSSGWLPQALDTAFPSSVAHLQGCLQQSLPPAPCLRFPGLTSRDSLSGGSRAVPF